jgi:hypothetical protein
MMLTPMRRPATTSRVTRYRVMVVIFAVVLGGAAGGLTVEAGGSIRAVVQAGAIMCASLGIVSLLGGALNGLRNDLRGSGLMAVATLVGFYGGVSIVSPFSASRGDILLMLAACVPVTIGAMLGYFVGSIFRVNE